MLTTLLFDFSGVLALPKAETQSLSQLYHDQQSNNRAFSQFMQLNEVLVEFVRTHPQYPAHIFSASSVQMLEEVSGFLIPPFVSFISASHENLPKRSPESYQEVAFRLGVKTSELLFIDDSPENLRAAATVGVTTVQYSDPETFLRNIRVLLPVT